jgi:hypothetical protein
MVGTWRDDPVGDPGESGPAVHLTLAGEGLNQMGAVPLT